MATRWTSKHTGQKIDDTIDCVCNPNLLDNWYFCNPVDQRGGYVVPKNTVFYNESTLTTERGTISQAYYPAQYANETYGTITFSGGSVAYVKHSDMIRGYTGTGYTIDRWKSGSSSLKAEVTSDGLVLSSTSTYAVYFSQYFDAVIPSEGSYTISTLVEAITGTAYFQAIYADGTYGNAMKLTTGLNALTVKATKTISRVLFQINSGSSVTVKAAKLELGSQQTLAHQDADGNWMLNEIPDYGEQLRRCQRYYIRFINAVVAGMTNSSGTKCFGLIPLPTTMRVKPAIVSYNFNYGVANGTRITSVSKVTVQGGLANYPGTYLQFEVTDMPTDTTFAAYLPLLELTADL